MRPADNTSFTLQEGLTLRRQDAAFQERICTTALRRHLQHAATAPFYNELFAKLGFSGEDITGTDDIRHLPLTDRAMLTTRNDDFIAAGVNICDIAYTSGTTAAPVVVPYTAGDLERLAYNEAIAFHGAGLRPKDKVLLTVTLDKGFIAGLAYYSGTTLLGAAAIRSGPGQMARQWHLIKAFKPTILLGVPSFLVGLARWGEANGYDPRRSSIRAIITIGESIRTSTLEENVLGTLLRQQWQVPLFSSYGATEVETSFCDCPEHRGGHIHPELMIVEVVDESGASVPDGQPGEVVVTPLGVEGFPLVRLRTGDIARLQEKTCGCGWTTKRLGPIEGRISQRLKYKGTTLYPEMILQALQGIPGTEDSYIEVQHDRNEADDISIVIGTDNGTLDSAQVEQMLSGILRVTPKITLKDRAWVIEKTGKHVLRKTKRFFDYRPSRNAAGNGSEKS